MPALVLDSYSRVADLGRVADAVCQRFFLLLGLRFSDALV